MNRTARSFEKLGTLALAAASLVACSSSDGSGDTSAAPSQAGVATLWVHTADATFSAVTGARLEVTNGKAPRIEFVMETGGAAPGEGFLVAAWVPRAAAEAGSVTVPLASTLTDALAGRVERATAGEKAEVSSAGTLAFTIAKGQVTGTVKGASPTLDATFEGAILISCSVPQSELPGKAGATPDPGYDAPLVSDDAFTTAECAAFAALAR